MSKKLLIKPHSLTDLKKPWGVIRFIHKDGTEHEFYSVVNRMTGDRMSAFDGDAPGVNDGIAWVKSVFRDIYSKSNKVLGYAGSLKFDNKASRKSDKEKAMVADRRARCGLPPEDERHVHDLDAQDDTFQ